MPISQVQKSAKIPQPQYQTYATNLLSAALSWFKKS